MVSESGYGNEVGAGGTDGAGIRFDTRVAAYGVIIADGKVLLTHLDERDRSRWTLPGGALEFGENAETAAVREILEETGYKVKLRGLLGIESFYVTGEARWTGPRDTPLHSLCVYYEAEIAEGELSREVGGSTDDVAWFELGELDAVERLVLVDVGVELWRESTIRV